MYLAGDDDQAIFAWAGADVSRFIKEPAKERVLIYSKRISRTVQEQSMIAIGNISGVKKNKKYNPRDYEGLCEEIYNLDEIDLTKGNWLILATDCIKTIEDRRFSQRERFILSKATEEKVLQFLYTKQ